ncbi:MAG TPA: pyridoxamine 5'-phosphate oxidase family protein [Bosea sp. (in: a-proteobacteria)]|jgi:hypothetical protein|uniref:pyridoxamine 5'-phosphate oxidase family protein n=1 Tax=Bosea sp. (in: a-proteobacteria) TaxID=1871050 RepID=UPI002E158EF5|nr:pyridoxamine 5'-phosphate oxidase family protein [Bosea sp. (in: a-proteobacteria)]
MAETPFHEGERAAQALAGLASHGAGIRTFMPDQHRNFFATLPWLFAGVRDAGGWPLATVLTGQPGFATSPAPTVLSVLSLPAADDPAGPGLLPGAPIGLLGIEFETRRRNRANGLVAKRDGGGFAVSVAQSFGNCAKYIQVRHRLGDNPDAPCAIETIAGLDDDARTMIAQADTFFIASAAPSGLADGGVDLSHRGGMRGFVRLEGDTLTVPDFAGNRYFNTLGNLLLEPRAALLFVDFAKGTTLQLQGTTEIVWGGVELADLEGAERLWRFRVTRGWRRHSALPLRWSKPEFALTTLETGSRKAA